MIVIALQLLFERQTEADSGIGNLRVDVDTSQKRVIFGTFTLTTCMAV